MDTLANWCGILNQSACEIKALVTRRVLIGVALAIAVTVLLAATVGQCSTLRLHGRVVAIADGDTLTILIGTEQTKIRLWGIDCPEKSRRLEQQPRRRYRAWRLAT